jgi:hypothetical protein
MLNNSLLIVVKAATPAESARTEDPGLSIAREAAEVVPAESVCHNGNQHFSHSKKDYKSSVIELNHHHFLVNEHISDYSQQTHVCDRRSY